MTVYDVLTHVDENSNVIIYSARNFKKLYEYNGRGDIDESYNECTVVNIGTEILPGAIDVALTISIIPKEV